MTAQGTMMRMVERTPRLTVSLKRDILRRAECSLMAGKMAVMMDTAKMP